MNRNRPLPNVAVHGGPLLIGTRVVDPTIDEDLLRLNGRA